MLSRSKISLSTYILKRRFSNLGSFCRRNVRTNKLLLMSSPNFSICTQCILARQIASISNPSSLLKNQKLLRYLCQKRNLSFSSINRSSSSSDDKKNEDEDEKRNRLLRMGIIAAGVNAALLIALLFFSNGSTTNRESEGLSSLVTWNDFVYEMLAKGEVEELIVYPRDEIVEIILSPGAIIGGRQVGSMAGATRPKRYLQFGNLAHFEQQLRLAEQELKIASRDSVRVTYNRDDQGAWIIFFALVAVTLILFYRARSGKAGGQIKSGISGFDPFGSIRKAQFRLVDRKGAATAKTPNIKFADVAGLHEAKVEIQEFIDYLKRPDVYTKLGAKVPKGALLLGPPGCGKTLLAKALATESSVPFLAINGTDFVEMIGGLGAARVRDLFKEAKERAPCIIYIDELDAVGRKRHGTGGSGGGGGGGSSGEEDQTLNQLLVEMDGMDTDRGVIVLSSTNRSDILDKALLRPGRLDRHILIDFPTVLERKEIFELYLSKVKLDKTPDYFAGRMAQLTPGFSGADIFSVCNEAAIHAARDEAKHIDAKHLDHALERVISGAQKRSTTLSAEEKNVVAYHESGHALIGWLLKHTDALLKISIVPRTTAALGFSHYTPADRTLLSKEQLFDRMCMVLGGRAAENVIFGRVSTSAEDDLKKVTKLAYDQVRVYGMSDVVGPISFGRPEDQQQAQFMNKPYSKRFQHTIDQEAKQLVAKAYFEAEKILNDNKDKLEILATQLLSKEELTFEDVKKLIGPSPHGDKNVVQLAEQVLPPILNEPDPEPSTTEPKQTNNDNNYENDK